MSASALRFVLRLAAFALALVPAGLEATQHCPPQPGIFFDDFEPAPEPGWVVDTPVNLNGAVSPAWAAIFDPFAQSPTRSFFSDAQGLDLKDDRLVAPPQELTATSRLVFWHRFNTESTFDGGVLEVSSDGGASWQDVLGAGGIFVEGGYNGSIDPGFASPIGGRDAWTGTSPFADAMSRVEVDLGALGGSSALFRFRLVLDPLALGSLPGLGWAIDDVELQGVLVVPPSCPRPPVAEDDEATTPANTPVVIEVLANDSDPDGDPLTLDSVTDPPNGTATANPDGTATYTPDPGFVGVDAFLYTVCDPGGLCDEAGVTIVVEPPPVERLKVTGGGWIPTPEGKVHFGFQARIDGLSQSGRVEARARHRQWGSSSATVQIEVGVGTGGGLRVLARGDCRSRDGDPCTFEAAVEDGGEPGRHADRFEIRILDLQGNTLLDGGGVLGGGNIQIHE